MAMRCTGGDKVVGVVTGGRNGGEDVVFEANSGVNIAGGRRNILPLAQLVVWGEGKVDVGVDYSGTSG